MSTKKGKNKCALKRKFYEDREGSVQQKVQKLTDEDVGLPNLDPKNKFDTEEEAMLEKLVLGDLSSMLEKLGDEDTIYPSLNLDSDEDSGVEEGVSTPEDEPKPTTSSMQPAWHDEDDSDVRIKDAVRIQNRGNKFTFAGSANDSYSEFIKNRFDNIVGTPKWAQLEVDEEKDFDSSDSDDDIMRRANCFLSKTRSSLPRDVIKIKIMRNLNSETNCEGPDITSVQFHPKSTVALIAGLSGVASIVQVDGKKNSKLHSMKFDNFPINTAKFNNVGDRIFVGSRDFPYMFHYDMIEGRTLKFIPQTSTTITNFKRFQVSPDGQHIAVVGRFGNMYLLCARTCECISTFKMNGEVNVVTFNTDGSQLFSHGDTGEVYVWDVASRTCLSRFYDDGCITGTALAISPNGQFVATGSAQGVVNVYESSTVLKENKSPKPAKTLYNLTTSISSLSFNASSEILSMASNIKDNAIRLVHFPSMTVFSNFPGWGHYLGKTNATDFSLQSGYFGVANRSNKAYLFRLQHYGNY